MQSQRIQQRPATKIPITAAAIVARSKHLAANIYPDWCQQRLQSRELLLCKLGICRGTGRKVVQAARSSMETHGYILFGSREFFCSGTGAAAEAICGCQALSKPVCKAIHTCRLQIRRRSRNGHNVAAVMLRLALQKQTVTSQLRYGRSNPKETSVCLIFAKVKDSIVAMQ